MKQIFCPHIISSNIKEFIFAIKNKDNSNVSLDSVVKLFSLKCEIVIREETYVEVSRYGVQKTSGQIYRLELLSG